MERTLLALAVLGLGTACPYEPDTGEIPEVTGDDDGSSSGASSVSGADDSPTDPQTTAPDTTDTPADSESGPPAECGDGSVDGDEVCDDGVNDGSYGGCAADCSAFGPFCGDAEANGDEVCDDGTNDGSYGGCATDCTALGPYCGDGEMQDPEQCDTGADNENGSGCNVDCVISGSEVGTYMLGALDFCDGEFVTAPAFRANGNALVGATGYCNDDTVALVELTPAVELEQQFEGLLLPDTPVREATLAGDDWVLAGGGCNYRISDTGDLTEICEDRTVGDAALESDADGNYAALDYGELALYPAGSPAIGDAATWVQVPANDGTFTYYWADATLGASGSVVVAGSRQITGGTSSGYVARYTSAGNLAGSFVFPQVQYLDQVSRAPDGSVLVVAQYPEFRVIRLDANFDSAWELAVPTQNDITAAIDSTGAVVLGYRDLPTDQYVVRKLTPDGQLEIWNHPLPAAGSRVRISIDASDAIWLAGVVNLGGYTLVVQKLAP